MSKGRSGSPARLDLAAHVPLVLVVQLPPPRAPRPAWRLHGQGLSWPPRPSLIAIPATCSIGKMRPQSRGLHRGPRFAAVFPDHSHTMDGMMPAFARPLVALALLAGAAAGPADAQPYEHLRIIAPAAPGGGWDQTARVMQHAMQ